MLVKKMPQHEAVKSMEIGDPYTIIKNEPIRGRDGEPSGVGDTFLKWFATNEPGRVFRITAIHHETVYESVFVGFTARDPETGAWSIKPSKEGLPNDCPA